MKSYAEKLKDPRWQRKRLEVLQRADFKCEWCESAEKTLHVHHTIYSRKLDPWDYEDDCLLCLCENCHAEWHELKSTIDCQIALMSREDMERMMDFGYLVVEGRDFEITFK